MILRRSCTGVLLVAVGVCALSSFAAAQEERSHRGRKYKAPPETSHIEVVVVRETNKKPILNAAVIFHSVKNGKDEGNLEVKTNEDGKATIDVIPTGSKVDVQVLADGFATFAGEYLISEPSREIAVQMLRPRAQISAYVDTHGQAAQRPNGVQEPNQPSTPPVIEAPKSTSHTSDPTPLTPVSPNPTSNQNPTPR